MRRRAGTPGGRSSRHVQSPYMLALAAQTDEGAFPASTAHGIYRYGWLRDGCWCAYAFDRAGQTNAAEARHQWARILLTHTHRIEGGYRGRARTSRHRQDHKAGPVSATTPSRRRSKSRPTVRVSRSGTVDRGDLPPARFSIPELVLRGLVKQRRSSPRYRPDPTPSAH
jgi:hypothetical protein